MTIKRFEVNMLQENCYVVYDDALNAVIIDCGAYYDSEREAITSFVHNHQLRMSHVLCTHGHFDHCFGNDTLYEAFGLGPEVHLADEFLISDIAAELQELIGMSYDHLTPPVSRWLSDGDVISCGTMTFEVIHTPGHTPGSVCFYSPESAVLFSGDTLFQMSIGRTDFAGSSSSAMMSSLHRLAQLPPTTVVYPGHGPSTTIDRELRLNPYLH